MRICMIGDASQPLDEGMKKTTYALAGSLARHCDVLVLNPLHVGSRSFWSSLWRYHPDVVHYVPGPSLRSFVLLALIKRLTSARSVVSLTHPDPALPIQLVSRCFMPDLVLAQSTRHERQFHRAGFRVEHMPNGVDTLRFRSAPSIDKEHLRQRHSVSVDSYVVLHVGNTRRVRNLDILVDLQRDGCQVIVISSTTIAGDAGVSEQLTEAGCIVWNHYIENVEEIYMLADCYVFPTPTGVGAIEHPLSVIEAMACNLPVVTKRFGALPRTFENGDGLYFVDTDEELRGAVQRLRERCAPVKTRAKVAALDWNVIAEQLVGLYRGLAG